MRHALFIFLDGLGLGEAEPGINPVAAARLPTMERVLGGRRPLAAEAPWYGPGAALVGLDATLGHPGLPQSGTGHVALLTGENAVRLFGRHFGPWTPTSLRPLLARHSIFARAQAAGLRVAFANAYPEEVVAAMAAGDGAPPAVADAPRAAVPRRLLARWPRAGPPLAAHAAGLLNRHTPALARGEAVASEITNEGWRERLGRRDLPVILPEEAGSNLMAIARRHHLTLFAHYTLDHVGHRGAHGDAVAALERVDAFLGGVLNGLPEEMLLLIASDHGNVEDVRSGHTRNPAVAILTGPGAADVASGLAALTDVTPALLRWLGVAGPRTGAENQVSR